MKVYITGCLGFIGSHLTRRCLQLGWVVKGVDKCTYAANLDYLKEFQQCNNFSFEKIDIKELSDIDDCDYFINLAAESHVDNSINDSSCFVKSNIIGVQNILEVIRKKDNRPILFQFSTDEVYGDIISGSHTENDLLKPSNPYSATKAAADMLILAWARTYDINYLILRPTNNYGAGQYPEKLIPSSIQCLISRERIKLHDNGNPVRTWLHVEDTINAVIRIVESNRINEIFNVSGGFECKNIVVVEKIIKLFFNDENVNVNDFIDFSYNRKGQDLRYSLNDVKLRSLGWVPIKELFGELQKIILSR